MVRFRVWVSLDHSGAGWSWSCWGQAEEGRLGGAGRHKWGFCLVAAEVSGEESLEEDKASHSMSLSEILLLISKLLLTFSCTHCQDSDGRGSAGSCWCGWVLVFLFLGNCRVSFPILDFLWM